jgi:hypothetical protein
LSKKKKDTVANVVTTSSPAQSTFLAQTINEALTILEEQSVDAQSPAGRIEPLPSLLSHCESLVELAATSSAPLRLLHSFTFVGEDICTALLAYVPSLRLVPHRSICDPDAARLEDADLLIEAARVTMGHLHESHEARGLRLVVHVDHQRRYAALPAGLNPAPVGETAGLILTCHPLLSYMEAKAAGALRFLPTTLEAFSERYLSFLSDHANLSTVSIEEITARPDRALGRIAVAFDLSLPAVVRDLDADSFDLPGRAEGGPMLRYGDGTPAIEEPLDTPAYAALCQRLGYDPGNLPPPQMEAAREQTTLRRPLPARRTDRTPSRLAGVLPLIARITDQDTSPDRYLLDAHALVERAEDCLGHPDGFYEALDRHLAQLSPREAALLLITCAAHHVASNESVHALSLLAEAEEAIGLEDRRIRLLAAELYLRLRKPDLALALMTADAVTGPFRLEPQQQAILTEAIKKHAPNAANEHGHSLLLTWLGAAPPRSLDRPRVMIEIGTTRERVPGQGSTLLCVELGIDFLTVDMDPRNSAVARRMFRRLGLPFRAVTAKGEDFLAAWDGPIDYCFLDAYDFDHGKHSELRQSRYETFLGSRIADEQCHQMHLDCAVSLVEKLSPDGVICFDDTWKDADGLWTAKGKTAMPYLLGNGFCVIEARNRAALLVRGD